MLAIPASIDTGYSNLPFAPGYGATASGFAEAAAPRLIRSVVDEAGLGRFVYLQGNSGRRYVFSSIRRDQSGLYDHAVFAVTDTVSGSVTLGRSVQDFGEAATLLYVHLLDDAVLLLDGLVHELCVLQPLVITEILALVHIQYSYLTIQFLQFPLLLLYHSVQRINPRRHLPVSHKCSIHAFQLRSNVMRKLRERPGLALRH